MFGRFRVKRRQIGSAALLVRFRNGICAFTCYQCRGYSERYGWRRALREARGHSCPTRYDLTPTGLDAIGRRQPARRSRRLAAAAIVAVLLATLAFAFVATVGRASSAPATPTTTTTAGAAYTPSPAGPPVTDANGQWISEPDPSAGGGR